MIRRIQEKDLNDILEIYNDAIVNTTAVYDYTPHTIEDRRLWYKQKIEGGYPVLVFEENHKIIGFATFGPFRAWPAYKYTIEHSVYVHKDYRKNGIGTTLLKEIIRIANEQKYATLVAGIDAANEKSIKVHERLGFTYSGTIKKAGFKFGKWLDLAFYQLDLNGPERPTEG
ncbi:GNAT family N-acetyltransferase [Ectobacillus panaciterrae]|uniref:GNAT family N-acetyltransferase n=1 Tax=Ectobacillus panaciterrae TaxID=363872 RepID=UPI0003FD0D11|nr:GNAT family N-acetyltransferase [Ectobacillus panaciterrae]